MIAPLEVGNIVLKCHGCRTASIGGWALHSYVVTTQGGGLILRIINSGVDFGCCDRNRGAVVETVHPPRGKRPLAGSSLESPRGIGAIPPQRPQEPPEDPVWRPGDPRDPQYYPHGVQVCWGGVYGDPRLCAHLTSP